MTKSVNEPPKVDLTDAIKKKFVQSGNKSARSRSSVSIPPAVSVPSRGNHHMEGKAAEPLRQDNQLLKDEQALVNSTLELLGIKQTPGAAYGSTPRNSGAKRDGSFEPMTVSTKAATTADKLERPTPGRMTFDNDDQLGSASRRGIWKQEKYPDGSWFEGYVMDDLREGKGTYHFNGGARYDGDWKRGKMSGWGKLTFGDGSLAYEGEWIEDKFHGYGTLCNGEAVTPAQCGDIDERDLAKPLEKAWIKYEGGFKQEKKNGFGVILFGDGSRFEGNFNDDMIDGNGKYVSKDGKNVYGVWSQGKLIQTTESS
jgi:hypothetical protein